MNTKDMIRICEHNGWRVYKNDCSELIFEAVNDVGSYYHFYVRTNHIVDDCEMAARHIANKLYKLYQILSATKN